MIESAVGAIFFTATNYKTNFFFFRGVNVNDLVSQFNEVQDLPCLVETGESLGTKKDKMVLKQLESFLSKYYEGSLEMTDLKKFSIKLSIGYIGVRAVAKNPEEVQMLEKEYQRLVRK